MNCAECEAISSELSKMYIKALYAFDDIDSTTLANRFAEWKSFICDGERNGETLPVIAPEILDPKLRKPDHQFAQLIRRKFEHEHRTGHKIKFPHQT